MTAASPQLAAEAETASGPRQRSPLAHLLHALNQPLTGLQCSLELAVSGPRRPDEYVRTLREGLDLTSRMRVLVEAIRELADIQQSAREAVHSFSFDDLVREAADDLLPVAETKQVRISLASNVPLSLRGNRRRLQALMFRFLESAVSLARAGTELRILARPDGESASLALSWKQGPSPEHSPFSQPELGLLISQAGWEQAGAAWAHQQEGDSQTCTVRLPLAPAVPGGRTDWEI